MKAGELYSIHKPAGKVRHPETGKNLGTKIDTTGTLRVLLVQPETATAVIEQAFDADTVDLSVLGDWEEAQILLGLLEERVTSAPNFFELEFGPLPSFSRPRIGKPAPHKANKKKKGKRKRTKASRKRTKASRKRNRRC